MATSKLNPTYTTLTLDAPALASAIAGAMEELPQPRPNVAAMQLATAIVAARHREK